ncbi:BQ5605_C001g00515 [Microbotryum silenes-dioicae]|uniref:BQ5605_C001g00515 protein n=1 Tax=Microbotryum silenes-dioicae TaxID=796604 RepID=A0A2X0P612_9BASI|nr:BQ5605_C001g00515 [Microbotryum silenes-dioicae]
MSSVPVNYAAVLHGPKDLRLTEREVVAPVAGEAQVAVKATGLCGSDMHYYIHGAVGDFKLRHPMALGHESAGVVTAVGEGVTSVAVGDRVAIEAGVYCGQCRLCKTGRYNLCGKMRFNSSAKVYPHADGSLQTFLNHPARNLHKLPDACSYEAAALVEPLSVVLHASRRANISAGQSVLVLGAGAVGILALAVAKAHGATHLVVVDINEARVNFSVQEGFANAGHILPRTARPENSTQSLEQAKTMADDVLAKYSVPDSDGFDVVLECTGVETCMQAAVHAARPGGKVVYIGMGTPNATLPVSAAAFREVDLLGVFRYVNTYPDALALFGAGRLPGVEKLVTTRHKLSDVNQAFEELINGVDKDGKMIIKMMIGDY